MPRLPRRRLGQGAYHVLNRGVQGFRVLESFEDRRDFLGQLKSSRRKYPVRILHWVIMGNHFHLLLEASGGRALSGFMAGLQRSFSDMRNRRLSTGGRKASGRQWQGRFKCSLVERESYLLACGRYVEVNPVRAGVVDLPWDYQWSSARAHAIGLDDGLTDVRYNPMYLGLAPSPEERQALWRCFLGDRGCERYDELFRGCRYSVGGKKFLRRIRTREGRPSSARQGMRIG
jgi:putative transposase